MKLFMLSCKTAAFVFAASALFSTSAQAANFLNVLGGLFGTGLDSSGNMLTDNQLDDHYRFAASNVASNTDVAGAYAAAVTAGFNGTPVALTSSGVDNVPGTAGFTGYDTSVPSDVGSGTGAVVTPTGTVANTTTWITTSNDGTGAFGSGQFYTYRTTFTLGSHINLDDVVINGLWASDNRGKGIYINGIQMAVLGQYGGGVSDNANYGSGPLASFGFSNIGNLVHGTNTIDFQMTNAANDFTGLRVQFTRADSFVPEPTSLVLLASGILALGAVRRRQAS